MAIERYEIQTSIKSRYFEFISTGINGNIVKVVKYTHLKYDTNVFNLGFGDKNSETGHLNDSVTTNNGDTDKVLATVAYTIYEFFEEFPDAIVYISGVTPSRTRLYQINISKFFDHISNDFEVLGELEEGFERFKKNINYLGFAIKQK